MSIPILPPALIIGFFVLIGFVVMRYNPQDGFRIEVLFLTLAVLIGSVPTNYLHHFGPREYLTKKDSVLSIAQSRSLYLGQLPGKKRSYKAVRKTFIWKYESFLSPKEVVVFEAKGSVWAAEEYRRIQDSLENILSRGSVRLDTNKLHTDPLNFIGNGVYPHFQYSDIKIRGLRFWPAVRFKHAGLVYEDRWSYKKHTKEDLDGSG